MLAEVVELAPSAEALMLAWGEVAGARIFGLAPGWSVPVVVLPGGLPFLARSSAPRGAPGRVQPSPFPSGETWPRWAVRCSRFSRRDPPNTHDGQTDMAPMADMGASTTRPTPSPCCRAPTHATPRPARDGWPYSPPEPPRRTDTHGTHGGHEPAA